MSGTLTNEGDAKLIIELKSVETNIPVRNDRMKQFLFEVDRFPEALVELKIDKNKLSTLNTGAAVDMNVKAMLKLHGGTQDLTAKLRVVKIQDNALQVTTMEPVVLNLVPLGLQAGLDKLKEIAKLDSITATVPVTLTLVFNRQ